MKLGELINNYRRLNKVTMLDLAEKSGLSKGYISMLEKGFHPNSDKPIVPSIETLSKLSKAMGISLDDLIRQLDGDTDIGLVTESTITMINASMAKMKLIEEIDCLDDSQIEKVLTFIEMIK